MPKGIFKVKVVTGGVLSSRSVCLDRPCFEIDVKQGFGKVEIRGEGRGMRAVRFFTSAHGKPKGRRARVPPTLVVKQFIGL